MSSPSLVAAGLDPAKGVIHVMVKTENRETRKTLPLSPHLKATFDIVRGILG